MSEINIPATQSAWLVTRRGPPNKSVELKKDFPVPSKLDKGEVVVKVHAGALNPVGWKVMRVLPNFVARRPHVAEHDISGVVVDPNDSEFKKGDAVFGWLPVPVTLRTGQGALAQYARVRADHLTPKPTTVDFIQAAGIALAGLTAYQGLDQLKLNSGQTVFINGGTTAVGSFAVQMAKAKGCKVVSSCSTSNVETVKGLGADEVIDYKTTPVIKFLEEHPPSPKFQAIYDTVGSSADLFTHSPAYLAPDGTFVSVGVSQGGLSTILGAVIKTSLWPAWLGGTRRKFRLVSVSNKKNDMDALGRLIEEGAIKPLVDSTYGFEDVHKAYDRILTGRAKGKVVVEVVR